MTVSWWSLAISVACGVFVAFVCTRSGYRAGYKDGLAVGRIEGKGDGWAECKAYVVKRMREGWQ